MREKPEHTSGRKRRREDIPASGEDGEYLAQRNRSNEGKKQNVKENIHIGGGDGHMSSTKRPTSTRKSLRIRQLEDNTADEPDDIYPTILPNFGQSSVPLTKRNLRARSSLCKRCAKIDLDMLLSRPHKTYLGQLAATLVQISDWKIDSCTFCSLLSSTLLPTLLDWQQSKKIPLRSFSSNNMTDKIWSSIDTNLLQLHPWHDNRYLVSQPEGINGPVKIIKEDIDEATFERVKKWINLCQNQHTKVCSVDNPASVPGLKLIDCETNTLIPGESHPYVALSYVWGCSSDTSEDPNQLPKILPNTIKDTITVTKRLGFRYLWIDRYCINQQNEEEKSSQVGRMDSIYQNAELTIIAAAGDDPNYGLPGVGERKRKPQHLTTCTKIGEHFLISTDATPRGSISGTRWITRGWTYQEGLLSRRRLVFVEKQIIFECYGMYCCESLDFPLEDLHRTDMQGFKSVFCGNHLKQVGMFPRGVGTTSREIVERIEEYSKRHMGDPTDILKGMLGIFNAFERSRLAIYHCSGIPILPSMPEKAKPIERWTPAMGFFTGLFWNMSTRSERRAGFPSWSWTGWHGAVRWGGLDDCSWPSIKVDPNVQLSVETMDGRVLKWEDFQELKLKADKLPELSNIIRITAWTIQICIHKRDQLEDEDQYKARMYLEDSGSLDWRFKSFSKVELLRGQVCTGIILGEDIDPFYNGPAILVVSKVGDVMERIGIAWVDQLNYKRWDKDGVWEYANAREESPLWTNPLLLEPLEFVKSWEEIRLG
jgi:hypothetical protein